MSVIVGAKRCLCVEALNYLYPAIAAAVADPTKILEAREAGLLYM